LPHAADSKVCYSCPAYSWIETDKMLDYNRRKLLWALLLTVGFMAAPALAKDGESGGGGSDNSGSGSDNSGSGDDSDDDNDNDEDNNDNNTDDDNSRSHTEDHNRALRAVQDGKAVSLRKLKSFLSQNYPGKLLKVSLQKKSGKYIYRVRILSNGNRIKIFSLNALTLKPGAV
jgi:uncharacterized membrane protein YkoI